MKKYIAIFLALIMLMSLVSCNKDEKTDESTTTPPVELNIEEVKNTWQEAAITFESGNTISLPCTVKEFVEKSGEGCTADMNAQVEPEDTATGVIGGEGTRIKFTCKNTGDEPISLGDAVVIGFDYHNSGEGSRKTLVAGSLTINQKKDDVVAALGEPYKEIANGTLYKYRKKNSNGKMVELTVSFSSDNLVNAILYDVNI